MAVTRLAYTDLTLSFTLGANTNPSSTDAAAHITTLYRKYYSIRDGSLKNYSATDANIPDKEAESIFSTIKGAAERIIENHSDYYSNPESNKKVPVDFDDKMEIPMLVSAQVMRVRRTSMESETYYD